MLTNLTQYNENGLKQYALSTQQFEKLFGSLAVFVFVADLDGRLIYVSQNSELILGYYPDELLGGSLLDIIHEDYQEKIDFFLLQASCDQVSTNIEAWLQQKNGNTFPGAWTIHWDKADKLFYGSIKDITEQKAKSSLQELHKQRLRVKNLQKDEMLERINDGFIAMDQKWRIIYTNTKAEVITKKRHSEVLGKNVWDVFPRLAGGRFQMECLHAMVHQQPVQFVNYEESLDIWFDNRIYPSGNGLSVFFFRTSASKKKLRKNFKYPMSGSNWRQSRMPSMIGT